MIKVKNKCKLLMITISLFGTLSACAQSTLSDQQVIDFYSTYTDELNKYESETIELEGFRSEGGLLTNYSVSSDIELQEITLLSNSGRTEYRLIHAESLPQFLVVTQSNYDPFEYPENIVIMSQKQLYAIIREGDISIIDGDLNISEERIMSVLAFFK